MDSANCIADKAIGRMQEISDKIISLARETIRHGRGLTSLEATKLRVALEDIGLMLEQDSLVFQDYLDKVNNVTNHVDDDYVASHLSSPTLLKKTSVKTGTLLSTSKTCVVLNMTQIRCLPLVTMRFKLVDG